MPLLTELVDFVGLDSTNMSLLRSFRTPQNPLPFAAFYGVILVLIVSDFLRPKNPQARRAGMFVATSEKRFPSSVRSGICCG
jgi:hypothetical protein